MREPRHIPSTRQMLLVEQANRAMAEFLRIDVQMALTFSGIALSTTDFDKRERTTKVARRACDAILTLRPGVRLTDIEAERLARDLERPVHRTRNARKVPVALQTPNRGRQGLFTHNVTAG